VHSEPTRDFIHHSIWCLLLKDDALRAQKRGCHFPKMIATHLWRSYRMNFPGVCWRYCGQAKKYRRPSPRPHGGVYKAERARGEA
jgi:hypothetical protein